MRGVLVAALLSVCLVAVAMSAGSPYVSPRDVVNAASLTPSRLPGGSIARGSEFQLSGVGLGPRRARSHDRLPLRRSLAGVTVSVTAGGATYAASPTYVSSSLVRAVLPQEVPAGLATVRVTSGASESNPVTVRVVDHSPGLFSINGLGYGPGRITHTDRVRDEDDDDDGDDEEEDDEEEDDDREHRVVPGLTWQADGNANRRAHRLGALATLVGTGFGAGSDDPADVDVFVGGARAEIFFVRRSSRLPGVDEVSFRIPPDAPHGCYVPVQVVVGGVASNAVTMAIGSRRNGHCSDDFNPASTLLREGGNVALALLSRVVLQHADGSSTASDLAIAAGRTMRRDNTAFERVISWPPPGSCTVYSSPRQMQLSLPGQAVHLGHLSVTNAAKVSRSIPFLFAGFYEATWGRNDAAAPMRVPPPAFLDPGVIRFAASGGRRVGPFTVERTLEAPPTWLNAPDMREITRSEDVTVEWSGTGNRQVFVMGSATSNLANASVSFQCLAPPGVSSMKIPAAVLNRLPSVRRLDGSGAAAMEVGAFATGTPATFDARGLRAGVLFVTSATAQAVRVK